METLTFKSFRAIDDPAMCAEFLKEHRKVLEDFGITNVTTNNDAWTEDPGTHVIVALSNLHGLVGGIRVEVDGGQRELPIESALQGLDHRITTTLSTLRPNGNAEVCGLWNSNRYAAMGLPSLLAYAAVSLGNQIGLRSMVCLVAHYTLRHALKSGFTIMEEIGNGGTFTYPIPSIKAIAMVIPDVIALSSAPIEQRRNIMSLRLRPEQERIEMLGSTPTRCIYQLCIDKKVLDLRAYVEVMQMHFQHAASA
ncbi:MAG: hypothetical protein WAT74_09500 [Flavobacteriales bacterium]